MNLLPLAGSLGHGRPLTPPVSRPHENARPDLCTTFAAAPRPPPSDSLPDGTPLLYRSRTSRLSECGLTRTT